MTDPRRQRWCFSLSVGDTHRLILETHGHLESPCFTHGDADDDGNGFRRKNQSLLRFLDVGKTLLSFRLH